MANANNEWNDGDCAQLLVPLEWIATATDMPEGAPSLESTFCSSILGEIGVDIAQMLFFELN